MSNKKKDRNKTLYDDLEIEKNATPDTIKKAFRKKAKTSHPDTGGNPDEFRAVVRAYNILGDEEKRKRYDNGENPDLLDKTNTQEQQALSMVLGILNAAAEQTNLDISHLNLFDAIKQTIRTKQQNSKNEKTKVQSNVERCENMIKRIKKNGKSEPFIAFLNQKIKEFDSFIAKLDIDIKVCDDALNLIDGCEYEYDPVMRQFSYFGTSGTTTTS